MSDEMALRARKAWMILYMDADAATLAAVTTVDSLEEELEQLEVAIALVRKANNGS